MGYWARLVWYRISPPDDHKSLGIGRIHTTLEHEENQEELWTIHTDGSSTQKRGGVGVVITSPKEDVLKYGVQLKFPITNIEAEYEAILAGQRIARALRAKNILLRSDSQLAIGRSGEILKQRRQERRNTSSWRTSWWATLIMQSLFKSHGIKMPKPTKWHGVCQQIVRQR